MDNNEEFGADARAVSELVSDARSAFEHQLGAGWGTDKLLKAHAAFNNAITELVLELEESRRENVELTVTLKCEKIERAALAKLALRNARVGARYK